MRKAVLFALFFAGCSKADPVAEHLKQKTADPSGLAVVHVSAVAPHPDNDKITIWLVRYRAKNELGGMSFYDRFLFKEDDTIKDSKSDMDMEMQYGGMFAASDEAIARAARWKPFWDKAKVVKDSFK